MASSSVKRVIMFPERHDRPRTREAIAFAKKTASQGFAVKLFVEGVMAGDIARLSNDAGFPITCIEDERIKRTTDISMFLTALHGLNAFRWSVAHVTNGDCAQFLKDAARSAYFASNPSATNLPSGPVRLDIPAIRQYLVAECMHPQVSLKKLVAGEELQRVISASLTQGEHRIPQPLLDLTVRLLNCIPQHDLDQMASALLPGILRFFSDRYGVSAYYAGFDNMHTSRLSKRLHAGHNPMEARAMLARLETRLMSLREMFMAYSIAKEAFDYGIVNVGIVHTMSMSLCGTLSDAGMEIYERPIQPL